MMDYSDAIRLAKLLESGWSIDAFQHRDIELTCFVLYRIDKMVASVEDMSDKSELRDELRESLGSVESYVNYAIKAMDSTTQEGGYSWHLMNSVINFWRKDTKEEDLFKQPDINAATFYDWYGIVVGDFLREVIDEAWDISKYERER